VPTASRSQESDIILRTAAPAENDRVRSTNLSTIRERAMASARRPGQRYRFRQSAVRRDSVILKDQSMAVLLECHMPTPKILHAPAVTLR
jgi:hypothetical protein